MYPDLPTLREVGFGVHVFREKTVLVGNAQKIEDGRDEVQVRHQDRLRELFGELLVAFGNARPKPRNGLPQRLRIDLGKVRSDFEPS